MNTVQSEHARVVMYMSAGTLVCVEAAKKTSEPLLATKWLDERGGSSG